MYTYLETRLAWADSRSNAICQVFSQRAPIRVEKTFSRYIEKDKHNVIRAWKEYVIV